MNDPGSRDAGGITDGAGALPLQGARPRLSGGTMNYYRRYIGDYQRDTAHLSLCEHGAYAILLDTQYATGQPLPAEYPALYRLCRAMEAHEQAAVRSVADQFFPIGPAGKRSNPRAEKELEKAAAAIEEMRAGGSIGAAKRWGKNGVPYGVGHANPNREANGVEHGGKHGVAIDPPTSNLQPPVTNHQEPKPEGQGHRRASAPRTRKPNKQGPVPDDFTPSERVIAWAKEKGYGQVAEHCAAFVRKCQAKGYTYADHDAALMEAIREDWAKLRANGVGPPVRAKEIPILPPGVKPPPGYLRSGLDKLP